MTDGANHQDGRSLAVDRSPASQQLQLRAEVEDRHNQTPTGIPDFNRAFGDHPTSLHKIACVNRQNPSQDHQMHHIRELISRIRPEEPRRSPAEVLQDAIDLLSHDGGG